MVDTVEQDTGKDVTADKKVRRANPEIVAQIEDLFYGVTDATNTKRGVHLYTAWCAACQAAADSTYVPEDNNVRQTLAERGFLDEKGQMPEPVREVMRATAHLDTRNLKLL